MTRRQPPRHLDPDPEMILKHFRWGVEWMVHEFATALVRKDPKTAADTIGEVEAALLARFRAQFIAYTARDDAPQSEREIELAFGELTTIIAKVADGRTRDTRGPQGRRR
jgi:hypothetical protein